ncbi:MAG: leucine-rich repeat protein, partial [Lachnospiraceae bacterium]|nr:leucine-rich repeat protein [Lachnospiraceae bacterium]
MKKRVLALILASVITLTNGNIAFAAEANVENTTDTMVMERAVGESTQPKPEEVVESEEQEEVAEDDPVEKEDVDVTNTDMVEKTEESIATTTSESTENLTVETPEDVPEQGTATEGGYYGVNMGDNITWTYDAGTLRFSGKGDMNNILNGSRGERAPWYNSDYRDSITNIVIEEGITSVGSWAFISLVNVTTVTIPSTVTVIQPHAFQNCQGIKCMNLPNGLTAIGTNAFLFMDSCEEFKIDDKSDGTHPAFYTEDGVLFNNKTLITYPQGNKRTSYRVPYGIEEISFSGFQNTPNLINVYIPETMTKVNSCMFSNERPRSVYMNNPIKIYFCATTKDMNMVSGVFECLPGNSRIYVKQQEICDKINNGNTIILETGSYYGNEGDVKAEVYQQTETYSAYEALKKTYANNTYRLKSGRTTLFRYEAADAPTATDTTAWTSSNTDIANSPDGMGYITGGTKPGTATITVTREDGKESFSFTVVNVVPTTSTEIYHQADGKQQVLGNSLCIHTGKSDTVSLQTVPGLTTGLTNGVTWSVSDPSKVSVKAEGDYHEKATLYRKAAGDVTVTATMEDENGNAIQKSFQVIGDKSTKGWYVLVNDGERVWVTDSTPVEPIVVVRDSNGTVFKEGTDYTVQYQDNYLPDGRQACGVYVYVTPIGSYVGNPVLTGLLSLCRGEQPDDEDDSKNPDDHQKTDDSKKTPDSQNPSTTNKLKKQKITKVSSTYKKSVGQSFTLKPKAKGKITYKTGNKKVATVNSKGKVTVKGTGKATITVTAKATSTYSKSVKKITVYGVPKKPEMKKLTAGKKKFTVQWKKDKKADGYQVQYSTDKKFKKNVKSVNVSKKSTKATVKKLKKRKTYRVRVRSY